MLEMTTEKVFHADDKYDLRLLNVVIHEHQFKRKGKYYKFHFDKVGLTVSFLPLANARGKTSWHKGLPVVKTIYTYGFHELFLK